MAVGTLRVVALCSPPSFPSGPTRIPPGCILHAVLPIPTAVQDVLSRNFNLPESYIESICSPLKMLRSVKPAREVTPKPYFSNHVTIDK